MLQHASSAGHAVEASDTQYASRNVDFLNSLFENEVNREAFLQKSSLFERVYRSQHQAPSDNISKEQRQLSAKLHCLYGKPILKVGRLRSARTYPYACSKVYDIRQYTAQTRWGPFMNDGSDRVDWEKVEAILIVLGNNVYTKKLTRLFSDIWDNPFSGSWKGSFISSPSPDITSLDAMDPYGVTGTWYRVRDLLISLGYSSGLITRGDWLTHHSLFAFLTTTISSATTLPTLNETSLPFILWTLVKRLG